MNTIPKHTLVQVWKASGKVDAFIDDLCIYCFHFPQLPEQKSFLLALHTTGTGDMLNNMGT